MKRVFVQVEVFSKRIDGRGGAKLLEAIEAEILENPLAGDVIPGTGGVRKMRVADSNRGKGKRGGYRVLFLDLPDQDLTYLLYFYGKDEAEDLTQVQKKQIQLLVRILKGGN